MWQYQVWVRHHWGVAMYLIEGTLDLERTFCRVDFCLSLCSIQFLAHRNKLSNIQWLWCTCGIPFIVRNCCITPLTLKSYCVQPFPHTQMHLIFEVSYLTQFLMDFLKSWSVHSPICYLDVWYTILPDVILFSIHIWTLRMILWIKQLYQMQNTIEHHNTVHAPASALSLGAQKNCIIYWTSHWIKTVTVNMIITFYKTILPWFKHVQVARCVSWRSRLGYILNSDRDLKLTKRKSFQNIEWKSSEQALSYKISPAL